MDLLYFLESRLTFIRNLYGSATSPFEETKRRIEAGEAPYADTRDPEHVDEPAFLAEWQEADDSIAVVGQWCLCMVQACLQSYLKECISPAGSVWWDPQRLRSALSQKQAGSWFGRYKLLFSEELGIEFTAAPVSLPDLEQLNLTRNDLIHNVDLLSETVERSEEHAQRFPRALFTDDLWAAVGLDRIRIGNDQLGVAIRLVRDFCTWLDGIRCNYPQWLRDSGACASR
ncbi:MAG: hypothetical protein LAO04_22125 [Acidobacteriia bacterium]|nr:hypothetical protein [Terriglobia bacterium]